MRTGVLIGYARVSTFAHSQLLDRQQHTLAEAGRLRVFVDKLSGRDAGSCAGHGLVGPARALSGQPEGSLNARSTACRILSGAPGIKWQ